MRDAELIQEYDIMGTLFIDTPLFYFYIAPVISSYGDWGGPLTNAANAWHTIAQLLRSYRTAAGLTV
jgi:hypothetical protein